MKQAAMTALAICILAGGCSYRSERVVEKPVPVPAERTVVTPAPTSTTTVYTTR